MIRQRADEQVLLSAAAMDAALDAGADPAALEVVVVERAGWHATGLVGDLPAVRRALADPVLAGLDEVFAAAVRRMA